MMRRTGFLALGALLIAFAASPATAQGALGAAPPAATAPGEPSRAVPSTDVSPETPPAPAGLSSGTPGMRVHELSPWSMFLGADVLVKAVMIGLALASLVTWTIFLAKIAELSVAKRRLLGALKRLNECRSLTEAEGVLGRGSHVVAQLVREALQEVRLSAGLSGEDGLKERIGSRFADVLRVESKSVRRGIGLLATIGSISPFVGLFGTVWGIMNSFIGISKAQTTNLAVVAPGIAEALLATAIGLVAAIPAVIIYNHFSRSTKSYLDLASRASGAVGRLLSRDLDRLRSGQALAQAAE